MAAGSSGIYRDDLENLTEEIVFNQLSILVEENKMEFCRCPICLQDIAAIVLNKVPPLYFSNFLEKIDPQQTLKDKMKKIRDQVKKELPKAISKVSEHSHH